jgi:molybdopterin/thiamine biosynthesis adenylyltransferase
MGGIVQGKVLIVGAGGLGAPAALRLAQSGAGHITLIDPEPIELSNLARQVIYRTADIGSSKAEVAARRLTALYSGVEVTPIAAALDGNNAAGLIARHDFIIDGTDNPAIKFLINDTCVSAGRPFAYGGVLGFSGQAMTVMPGQTACLRCLFEAPPEENEIASCREAGIVGPVAGIIGALQAHDAILFLRGSKPRLCGAILTYDARAGRTRVANLSPRPGCQCGAYGRPGDDRSRAISAGPLSEGKL